MRSWRNWQTRKTKDLVVHPMQVRFLSTAPTLNSLNVFLKKERSGFFLLRPGTENFFPLHFTIEFFSFIPYEKIQIYP